MWNIAHCTVALLFTLLMVHVRCATILRRGNTFGRKLVEFPRGGKSDINTGQLETKADAVTSAGRQGGDWRNSLPEQLQKRKGALHRFLVPTGLPFENVAAGHLENVCEVYLLGTAHVSKDSCEDVKLLMDHVRPDVLFIELCNQRLAILDDEVSLVEKKSEQDSHNRSVGQMTNEIMAQNPGMNKAAAMSSVLLSKIQGDYANKLNVTIGGEFREAFHCARAQQLEFANLLETLNRERLQGVTSEATLEEARSSNGCSIVLGDRPVRLTLLRAWESLRFVGKIKLVVALVWSSLRQPSEKELKEWIDSIMNDPTNDILSKSVEELGRHFPAIKKTIIEERDLYMACKVVQTVRIMGVASSRDGIPRKIVAVVGAGHCPGMDLLLQSEVKQPGTLDVETELRKVVETKKHRIENDQEMSFLITEVASMATIA